jgi:MoxR-like ATPase
MKNQPFNLYPPQKDKKTQLPDFDVPEKAEEIYLPSDELAAAVNVALAIGQPLLLTGEPGTGKTRLAYHIQQCFSELEGPFVFNAQTGSSKRDLFYSYDALGHFQWAHNRGEAIGSEKEKKDISIEIEKQFIRYEALGKAIKLAKKENKRSVVLIDEIDKAPRDLPNDLLAAIEELAFEVPEVPGDPPLRWECKKSLPPVIVITSNSEKNLPDAFLRRVVYHHIQFPDTTKLLEILQAQNLTGFKESDTKILVNHFLGIRERNLSKDPATAELIAWANLLPKIGFPIHKLKDTAKLTDAERNLLYTSYGVLAKNQDDLKKLIED